MGSELSLAEQAEIQIDTAVVRGKSGGWNQAAIEELCGVIKSWLEHPRFLDPNDRSLLRVTVLNTITSLLAEPIIGDHVWEIMRSLAREIGRNGEDFHGLRDSLRIATFELAAEPPEVPDFLRKLFSLAGDKDTRWAVFAAYENTPTRLRLHARRYSGGQVTDEDCDHWLIEQGGKAER
jgi:hypothetical protein